MQVDSVGYDSTIIWMPGCLPLEMVVYMYLSLYLPLNAYMLVTRHELGGSYVDVRDMIIYVTTYDAFI